MNALAACHRAYDAWRKTEPQLFWTNEALWPDDGLDEREAAGLSLVEPASDPLNLPQGAGSNQAPNRATTRGRELTAFGSLVAPAARSAGSAPPFAGGMAEQGVTGLCDSGVLSMSSASPERALPARGKGVGGATSLDCWQPPDSVTPCADRVTETTTAPPAHPSLGRRGRGDWR